jgi:chemotaxis family two-component system sensor kinase Cph1
LPTLSRAIDDAPARDDARAVDINEQADLLGAILANASLAAMDIADGEGAPAAAPLLEELEASTRRAAELYARMRLFAT